MIFDIVVNYNMDITANNAITRDLRSQSLQIIQMPIQKTKNTNRSIRPSLERHIGVDSMTGNIETSKWDPLKILIPITDAVLIIMGVIFVLALGIVTLIVVMAIIKVYFKDDEVDGIWTDDWFWPN